MLSYEFFVWLLFRSIDSLILIALAGWFFIRKALPSIRKKIAAEREQKEHSTRELTELELSAGTLDKQLIDDTHTIEALEQQVRLWQQAVKRKYNREIAEKDDIMVRLEAQDEQRLQAVARHNIYQAAVLEAVTQAEHALAKGGAEGAEVIEKIMQYMAVHDKDRA